MTIELWGREGFYKRLSCSDYLVNKGIMTLYNKSNEICGYININNINAIQISQY